MSISVEQFDYVDSARLFSQVAEQPWSIFLDSGVINERPPVTKHADFDVLAIKPTVVLESRGAETLISDANSARRSQEDPLTLLGQELDKVCGGTIDDALSDNESWPAYLPGALGYFSYDLARRYEHLPNRAKNDEQLPEMAMGIYSCIVLVDHRKKETLLIWIDQAPNINTLRQEWQHFILSACDNNVSYRREQIKSKLAAGVMRENMTAETYQASFDRVREYTIEGDCYQVNLAKQFSAKVSGDSWQTYDYLRRLSPAPYGAYMNFPFAQVLSNSPESFIQCRNGRVVTSPIKGTRARNHHDQEIDAKVAKELSNSPKDRAENLMIVDLMRNDLSTCCELGSVKVPKLFALHSFANVHHLISTVTGTLRQGVHCLELLRKCFPGGSITGAPKIRAMEIIEELEPHRRGLYCGAVGYVGVDQSMETNIAIRTIVVKDGIARYCAGGGLVIDSNVDDEYQEIVDKAKMMTEALFD